VRPSTPQQQVCPLCQREGIPRFSDHHLVPKSRGGKVLLPVCLDCHRSIHAFFTNRELADQYNTVEALWAHEGFAQHLRWLRKQDPQRRYRTKVKRERQGRRSGH